MSSFIARNHRWNVKDVFVNLIHCLLHGGRYFRKITAENHHVHVGELLQIFGKIFQMFWVELFSRVVDLNRK
jgi:hypothetical protein